MSTPTENAKKFRETLAQKGISPVALSQMIKKYAKKHTTAKYEEDIIAHNLRKELARDEMSDQLFL